MREYLSSNEAFMANYKSPRNRSTPHSSGSQPPRPVEAAPNSQPRPTATNSQPRPITTPTNTQPRPTATNSQPQPLTTPTNTQPRPTATNSQPRPIATSTNTQPRPTATNSQPQLLSTPTNTQPRPVGAATTAPVRAAPSVRHPSLAQPMEFQEPSLTLDLTSPPSPSGESFSPSGVRHMLSPSVTSNKPAPRIEDYGESFSPSGITPRQTEPDDMRQKKPAAVPACATVASVPRPAASTSSSDDLFSSPVSASSVDGPARQPIKPKGLTFSSSGTNSPVRTRTPRTFSPRSAANYVRSTYANKNYGLGATIVPWLVLDPDAIWLVYRSCPGINIKVKVTNKAPTVDELKLLPALLQSATPHDTVTEGTYSLPCPVLPNEARPYYTNSFVVLHLPLKTTETEICIVLKRTIK